MITHALLTFTFYRDAEEKSHRVEKLLNLTATEGQLLALKNVIELCPSIGAVNLFFIAEPPEFPLCSDEYIAVAKMLLSAGVIDAYEANLLLNGKLCRYYEGHVLAVAMVMADMKSIAIQNDERASTLFHIVESKAISCSISGFESDLKKALKDECKKHGFDLEFIKSLTAKKSFFDFF